METKDWRQWVGIKDMTDRNNELWQELSQHDRWNRRLLNVIMAYFGQPKNMLDVGSGTGEMVRSAREMGIKAYGIDLMPQTEEYFYQHDLRNPFDHGRRYQLILCIETAEHVDAPFAPVLVESIAKHTIPGSILFWTAAGPGQDGIDHVNCILGDTLIFSPNLLDISRRRYIGDTITIITSGGANLTVTPNHPILTKRGWVAAKGIGEGDYVVSSNFTNGVSSGIMPNINNRPSPIKEVFSTFHRSPVSRRASVPASPKDFHGDFTNGNVDIINSNGGLTLEDNVAFRKPLTKHRFKFGGFSSSFLNGFSSGNFRFNSINTTSPSIMGGLHHFLSGFGVDFRSSDFPSFLNRTDGNIISFESVSDGCMPNVKIGGNFNGGFSRLVSFDDLVNGQISNKRLADVSGFDSQIIKDSFSSSEIDMGLFRQFAKSFSRDVSFDKVVTVHCSNFDGHVYNLHTKEGYYFANDIITHNCQLGSYWRDMFYQHGLSYRADYTAKMQCAINLLVAAPSRDLWIGNIQIFDR